MSTTIPKGTPRAPEPPLFPRINHRRGPILTGSQIEEVSRVARVREARFNQEPQQTLADPRREVAERSQRGHRSQENISLRPPTLDETYAAMRNMNMGELFPRLPEITTFLEELANERRAEISSAANRILRLQQESSLPQIPQPIRMQTETSMDDLIILPRQLTTQNRLHQNSLPPMQTETSMDDLIILPRQLTTQNRLHQNSLPPL